jgi:ParB-like chromosome segregation protein Spo0J
VETPCYHQPDPDQYHPEPEQISPTDGEPTDPAVTHTVLVSIDSLLPADSPRFEHVDLDHAQALSSVDATLPPIVVHRQTMRVVDGTHRLRAARLRGEKVIAVQFFDGTDRDAFLLAVASNIQHGLPLTMSERRSAATRIIRSHPEMSDRSIAAIAGLAAKTIAGVRAGTQDAAVVSARVGRDGRTRPLNAAEGRRLAGHLFAAEPGASLRRVAREAGISVGTARDVRKRIRRGDDPTLPGKRGQRGPTGRSHVDAPASRPSEVVDPGPILEQLRQDPSLRYTESGRTLLRWLGQRATGNSDWDSIATQIPPHCAILVARIARGSAVAWDEFAEALDQHIQGYDSGDGGPAQATRKAIA